MYALTIHQPWAWAIAEGLKTIENRTWKAERVIGTRIAIHAAVRPLTAEGLGALKTAMGAQEVAFDVSDAPLIVAECQAGAGRVVATAVVDTFIVQRRNKRFFTPRAPTAAEAPWFHGPVGWVLRDVVRVTDSPVIRGQQGLWVLPAKALPRS